MDGQETKNIAFENDPVAETLKIFIRLGSISVSCHAGMHIACNISNSLEANVDDLYFLE